MQSISKEWFISNHPHLHQSDKFFSTNIEFSFFDQNLDCGIFIEGFIIPRLTEQHNIHNHTQEEIIFKLYKRYNLDFINYVKGSFIVIIYFNNTIHIFNDRHAIKKYFIYREGKNFIISNNLCLISCSVQLSFHPENAAIFCLMEHFLCGLTLFNNVKYSSGGTCLCCSKDIKIETYWEPEKLIQIDYKNNYTFEYFSVFWQKIIAGYTEALNAKHVSLTLTGGNDSRMILVGLSNLYIYLHAFTFGSSQSVDV